VKKNILIVGGASGIGKALAAHYIAEGHTICITGRKDPRIERALFQPLITTCSEDQLATDIDRILGAFKNINTLIYADTHCQRGHIDTFSDEDLQTATNIGLLAPMMLVQRLKPRVTPPLKVMLITSTSQYTPREHDPVQCATMSGLAMFGASLVRDRGIGKVLVTALPDLGAEDDTGAEPHTRWLADQIVELSSGAFKYKHARLLEHPAGAAILECLDNDLKPIPDPA
jgi:short-subunit dehydrogenase involved in D-alanine esterification of teichoic acids